VSLPSYIIQLFGTSSVPVIVGGTVLGVFELGERLTSQRAKDALSKWLISFDVQKTKALPDGTQELFERIFGERHFSLKCFFRSAGFSLGAMAFILILVLLIYPEQTTFMVKYVFSGHLGDLHVLGAWPLLTLWLLWSIPVDYISLLKTRVILKVLVRIRRGTKSIALGIVAIDFLAYKLLFAVAFVIISEAAIVIHSVIIDTRLFSMPFRYQIVENVMHWPQVRRDGWQFILFWAGFAPSLWMWLYVLALFVTRGLLRSEKLVNSLRWFLDIEKAPFRSIGAVAATLAFIASVAIILVSAEVSRITAAS
jgi:hypothetical protein